MLKNTLCVVVLFLTLLTNAAAQGSSEKKEISAEEALFSPILVKPEGSVNCFDYYTFGSVQVDVSPVLSKVTPDTSLVFKGKLKNSNPYPIVDGQVYVKIFKKEQKDESSLRLNGYPIVDFFLVKDAVTLGAKAEQDMNFTWKVPSGAEGEYQAAFYFTSAHRYNLLGLSFSDDVTGNKSDFSVHSTSSSLKTPVVFDKNNIKLNKTEYHPTTFIPHFEKDENITAYLVVKNTESIEKTIQISYITSKWDGLLSTNEFKRDIVSVTLKPKEIKNIAYVVPNVPASVTFLQAGLKDGDAQSLLHIRFARKGYEEIRINFPSITKYPISQNEESTIFSCVHATDAPLVKGGKLTLTLRDAKDAVVHTYVYNDSITGAMMGVKDAFLPKSTLSTFSLNAKLEKDGVVLEDVTMKYDCALLNKDLCEAQGVQGRSSSPVSMVNTIGVLLAAMGIVGVSYFIKARNNKNVSTESENDVVDNKEGAEAALSKVEINSEK